VICAAAKGREHDTGGCAIRRGAAAGSQDLVASAYTVHNFLETYRDQVLNEIFRVLRPSGIL
jgi:hypothetical protein